MSSSSLFLVPPPEVIVGAPEESIGVLVGIDFNSSKISHRRKIHDHSSSPSSPSLSSSSSLHQCRPPPVFTPSLPTKKKKVAHGGCRPTKEKIHPPLPSSLSSPPPPSPPLSLHHPPLPSKKIVPTGGSLFLSAKSNKLTKCTLFCGTPASRSTSTEHSEAEDPLLSDTPTISVPEKLEDRPTVESNVSAKIWCRRRPRRTQNFHL